MGRESQYPLNYRGDEKSRHQSAKELITIQPDLLLAQSTPTAATLVQQTSTIPIIFFSVGDPVGDGFVASLSRPGRNATGFINMEGSMSGKWLDLLREVAPHVRSVAILFNPATAPGGGSYYLKPFNAAARSVDCKRPLHLFTLSQKLHQSSRHRPGRITDLS